MVEEGKRKKGSFSRRSNGEASSILGFLKRICDAMGLRHARLQIWVFGRGMQLVDANDFACISLSLFSFSFFFILFTLTTSGVTVQSAIFENEFA